MKRSLPVVAFATLAALSMSSCGASAAPTAKPIFGTKPYRGVIGFGQVKPTRLGLSKNAVICDIHWDSWGGQIALGTGVGWEINPETYKRIPSAVVVYLYDLKAVKGKPAYAGLNFAPVPTRHAHPLKAC